MSCIKRLKEDAGTSRKWILQAASPNPNSNCPILEPREMTVATLI